MLILFPQTWILLISKFCCTSLKTTKHWSRWSLREEVPTMRHVSRTHRVAFDWLFDRINLDSKNPNQIYRHQEPTHRHTDEGKFHTWWIESSFVFVQHQVFQVHHLSWSYVEKNTRRCRWRKSHSKIKADVEFGITIQREGSRLHRKARWKPNLKVRTYLWARWMSKQVRGDPYWALAHQATQNGTLTTSGLLKSGNRVKCWEQERGDP